MQLTYTYEQDGTLLVGYLDQYPEHPTQAYSIAELESYLKEIYRLILDGTLDTGERGELERRHKLVKLLIERGVFFSRHGSTHDIFIHHETGKKIAIPQHSEFSKKFIKDLLKELLDD